MNFRIAGLNLSFTSAERTVLEKLLRFGYIGKRHCHKESVAKGFPKSEWGNIYSALEHLRRQRWINIHPTGYGDQVALNIQKILELKKLLGFPELQEEERNQFKVNLKPRR